jgi:hypothetical protein
MGHNTETSNRQGSEPTRQESPSTSHESQVVQLLAQHPPDIQARFLSGAMTYPEQRALLMPSAKTGGAVVQMDPDDEELDVSGLPEGPIRDAAAALAASSEAIDQNTAQNLVDGTVNAYYIEDLETPDDVEDLVTGYGRDPALFTIKLHPVSGDMMWVQTNAQGFRPHGTTDVFGLRSVSVERWQMLLVHETSHAMNPDATTPVERYKTEFRAYWVAEYRQVEDLDARAAQIKEHVLGGYPRISAPYNADPEVKEAIDAHTRPDGNLTNEAP